jgi:hypothetical protein
MWCFQIIRKVGFLRKASLHYRYHRETFYALPQLYIKLPLTLIFDTLPYFELWLSQKNEAAMTTPLNLSNKQVLALLIALAFVSVSVSAVANSTHIDGDWFSGLLSNLGTEMVGAVLTYGLFEIIIGERKKNQEKSEAIQQRKQELITQMRSQSRETALEAVELLRLYGWLKDGTLQEAELQKAKLQDVNLLEARMPEARLLGADLEGALLREANLQKANLTGANLQKARSVRINLQGAFLFDANLTGADLGICISTKSRSLVSQHPRSQFNRR